MTLKYKANKNRSYMYSTSSWAEEIPLALFTNALLATHNKINKFENFDIDIFSLLGPRNLSALVGEIFCVCFAQSSNGLYQKNPHQDGYPDLLLMNQKGQQEWEKIKRENKDKDKAPFSPFSNGGLEIKATMGSVPSPQECIKKCIERPNFKEQRIYSLKKYDWKAHHRETKNLIGILWDFFEQRPRIVAIFFCNNLTEDDWGKIVKPKNGGGRTTSVSIMSRKGVKKMYENWVLVLDDPRYISFLNKYNKDMIIPN